MFVPIRDDNQVYEHNIQMFDIVALFMAIARQVWVTESVDFREKIVLDQFIIRYLRRRVSSLTKTSAVKVAIL